MRLELFSGRDERLAIVLESDRLLVTLRGKADEGFLARLLEDLHQEALTRHLSGVALDLSALEPLEPAAVKVLIRWAMRQAELETYERYGIVLKYAGGVAWQKVSLAAIAHLCPYVRLEPIA
jgi:hypothetical protein